MQFLHEFLIYPLSLRIPNFSIFFRRRHDIQTLVFMIFFEKIKTTNHPAVRSAQGRGSGCCSRASFSRLKGSFVRFDYRQYLFPFQDHLKYCEQAEKNRQPEDGRFDRYEFFKREFLWFWHCRIDSRYSTRRRRWSWRGTPLGVSRMT